jgi:hypothetical protein
MLCNPSSETKGKALVQKGMCYVTLIGVRLQQLFRTFYALNDKVQILTHLENVAGELADDMVREGWTGKTVTLKYKLDTFQSKPRYFDSSSVLRLCISFLARVSQPLHEQSHLIVGSVRRRRTFLR